MLTKQRSSLDESRTCTLFQHLTPSVTPSYFHLSWRQQPYSISVANTHLKQIVHYHQQSRFQRQDQHIQICENGWGGEFMKRSKYRQNSGKQRKTRKIRGIIFSGNSAKSINTGKMARVFHGRQNQAKKKSTGAIEREWNQAISMLHMSTASYAGSIKCREGYTKEQSYDKKLNGFTSLVSEPHAMYPSSADKPTKF
ncbi:hypothetical protein NC651_031947 [Populus alba x Populus x berolinensis]|nr:hypothetical protein NC651_031947 [Populus alba x Populus x berolinensis]